jgi:outer membrane lipoprotein carrier protein
MAHASTRTLDAHFVQTKFVALLDEPLVSTGRLRFRRPDQVRLDVETPRSATILISGAEITIPGLSEQDRQALAGTPTAAVFRQLGSLFAGEFSRAPRHFSVAAQAQGEAIEVTLIPTAADWQRLFRAITLRFTGRELNLAAVRLDEALGDRLEVELRDVQRNVELADAVFQHP